MYFALVQDDQNLCILRMFEGTFSLDMAHLILGMRKWSLLHMAQPKYYFVTSYGELLTSMRMDTLSGETTPIKCFPSLLKRGPLYKKRIPFVLQGPNLSILFCLPLEKGSSLKENMLPCSP